MSNAYEPVILYEDNHILVVLKEQNVASCPDETGDENMLGLLKEYIRVKYAKKGNVYLGLVHRLDRPTGGVMVFAKTGKAASRLSAQMREGDFAKKYLAVLCGVPEKRSGRLTHFLKKNAENNTVYISTQAAEGAKEAVLDYNILEEKGGFSLAEIKLHTGRSHQIRVQMAGIGCPVFGDVKYGEDKAVRGKLALWAYSLSFTHPVLKERVRFMAEPPAELPWKNFSVSSFVKPE